MTLSWDLETAFNFQDCVNFNDTCCHTVNVMEVFSVSPYNYKCITYTCGLLNNVINGSDRT